MPQPLDDTGLDLIFRHARTHRAWTDQPVTEATLRRLYDLMKWGPTSVNSSPARFVFVTTPTGKARLRPHLAPGNVDKTMSAPVCVIVAYDSRFHEFMGQLSPGRDLSKLFAGKPDFIRESAERNSSLQGAYLITAARALGLDCGPMSGFNGPGLDAEFFADGRWKSNFLINLGYGAGDQLQPRQPRLTFEEACVLA